MRQEGLKPAIQGSENFSQEFPGFEGDPQESLGWIIPVTRDEMFWNLERVQQSLNKTEIPPVIVFEGAPASRKIGAKGKKLPVAA